MEQSKERVRIMRMLITVFSVLFLSSRVAFALGECGMSCCIAGATTSGVTLAEKFGISLLYEYTDMTTIRDGSRSISPNDVLNRVTAKWPTMPEGKLSFEVPTKMIMQKYTLLGAYPVTERFQLLFSVPYVINDMDMKMRMRSPMGMDMERTMKMDTVEGLGDITFMGLYTPYTDALVRPTKRLTLGMGLKTPTGKNDEKTDDGQLVHAMMQPGTGSWDPLFFVNYMRAFYPLILQGNLLYHLTTEGDEGYEFGDQLSLDMIARYQLFMYVSPGFEFNVLHAWKDKDHDKKYSRPETSLVDNPDNTGITSLYVTPSLHVKIPKTGGSADLKFQVPVYQHARGIQQVVDWRVMASIAWNF